MHTVWVIEGTDTEQVDYIGSLCWCPLVFDHDGDWREL